MVDRWKLYFGSDELDIRVHEIGTLSEVPPESEHAGPPAATREGPARVAFLGVPAVHKGWDVFLELVRRSAAGGNYRFYHFGDGRHRAPGVECREVSVAQNQPLAVVDALRAEAIDVALLWSLWEESFSYTAHEALSAGAAIITNENSGNIACVVRTSGEGLVLSDEDELFAAFESESILDLVRARRTQRPALADFAHSRMTADFANFDA
jgi:Glycosyl transferases group 1